MENSRYNDPPFLSGTDSQKEYLIQNCEYPYGGGFNSPERYPQNQVETAAPYVSKYSWSEDIQKNKPQIKSLAAATFIFISGGMSLAWSVGFARLSTYLRQSYRVHMQICWFVAVIIGTCIATALIRKFKMRRFNFIASILVIINGILFIVAPDCIGAIVIARHCDGIAFGLTLIPTIVASSEQSVKTLRGLVLSIEQVGLVTGVVLKTMYTTFWKHTTWFNLNAMHGILALVFGVLALLFTVLYTIDSPIFYLRKGNEAEAVNVLRQLQSPKIVTEETFQLLHENKSLVEEDDARGRVANRSASLIPMIKLCLFRAFVAMSFSFPLAWGLVQSNIRENNPWSLYIYGVMRLIGVLVAIFTLNTLGRKRPSVFSLLVGGILLIGVGPFASNPSTASIMNVQNLNIVTALLMIYQLFAGLAAPASTCYLGEAFSIAVKPVFILIVIVFENIIQIIVCCSFGRTFQSMAAYAYVLGALQIIFAIVFFVIMPETKKTTLREALLKFKRTINLRTG